MAVSAPFFEPKEDESSFGRLEGRVIIIDDLYLIPVPIPMEL
jgi:hypothetical protein